MRHRTFTAALVGAWLCATPAAAGGLDFYLPAGDLIPGSGSGTADTTVYAPGMRFPIEDGPAYPNSQVYNPGGYLGPAGGQCDASNYDYPWRDNYCETRSWDMPLCPAGQGHQGQDIRPATCEAMVHWNVAAEAGTITNIGSYSVYVTAPDGTRFDTLHGGGNVISSGQSVAKGEHLNRTSNEFGGTATTIHQHFNIKQDVGGVGFVYVSPYMSLVEAYADLMGLSGGGGGTNPPAGPIDAVDCDAIRGWAQDADTPDAAVPLDVYFDGAAGDANATGVMVTADEYREDLCTSLGSCDHGFTIAIPKSLRDNKPHPVHIYAADTEGGDKVQLDASPGTFACAPAQVPPGVRRQVASPEILAEWNLSPFWDLTPLSDDEIGGIEVGEDLPGERLVVRGDAPGEEATWWVIEEGQKRLVLNPAVAEAWGISAADVMPWPSESILDIPQGPDLPSEPFLVQGSDQVMWVIDAPPCEGEETCGSDPNDPDAGGDGGGADGGSADGGGDAGDGTDGDGGEALPGLRPGSGDDAGCACTTTANPSSGGRLGGTLWGLVVIAAMRRRRR